jgi:hypothetical protein
MKPHVTLISMMFGDMASGREFLATHEITSLADVLQSRRQVRAARTLQPAGYQVGAIPGGVDDLWLNVALSYQGLRKVAQHQRSVEAPADDSGNYVCALEVQVNSFDDNAFRLGLAIVRRDWGIPSPDAETITAQPSTTVPSSHRLSVAEWAAPWCPCEDARW